MISKRSLQTVIIISVLLIIGIGCVKIVPKALPEISSEDESLEQLLKKADERFQNQNYTRPEGNNAYELCQKALNTDPDNSDALKKIHDILEALFNLLDGEADNYGRLLESETKGEDVKEDMIFTLTKLIEISKDAKRICEEFPKKDTEEMIQILKDDIEGYEKSRSFYQKN
jgi:hypothetical protein